MTIPEKLHHWTAKKLPEFEGMTWYEIVDTIGNSNPAKKQLQEIPFTKENIEEIQPLIGKVWMKAKQIALQMRLDKLKEGTDEKTSPDGQLVATWKSIRSHLEDDLLEKLVRMSHTSFEQLAVGLLEKMGYGNFLEGAGKVTGKSGDKGIDGIVHEDKLGFDVICIQAKKYTDNTVPSKDVQAFYGALTGVAKKGVFITTSSFSGQAKTEAAKSIDPKMILIDGKQLVKLMIDHDFGVVKTATYEVKKIDTDFFDEDE